MSPEKPVVMTASEFKQLVRDNKEIDLSTVDVVTCATFGIMSGTMAFFSFFAANPGTFKKAISISFNGISGFVGPCPNESNGWVDAVFYGTSVSESDSKYGGGHLFKDIVSGKMIEIILKVSSDSDKISTLTLYKNINDFKTARMITTRSSFKNYTAFTNLTDRDITTIFSVLPLKSNSKEATVSGCGEINPLENDPALKHHKAGTKVLLNGSIGFILGKGTRSEEKPNLSISSDMKDMKPHLMGGFVTSAGPECMSCVATAIPVDDFETLDFLKITDENIKLPVACVSDRVPFDFATYADVWQNTGRNIKYIKENCLSCKICDAESFCPVSAINLNSSNIVSNDCVSCLTCLSSCKHGAFKLYSDCFKNEKENENEKEKDSGTLKLKSGKYSISLRQSDRNRAEAASKLLKDMIEKGDFNLNSIN